MWFAFVFLFYLFWKQALLIAGYNEDFFVSNLKICIGLVMVAVAAWSHFAPVPWPESKMLIGVCCIRFADLVGDNVV